MNAWWVSEAEACKAGRPWCRRCTLPQLLTLSLSCLDNGLSTSLLCQGWHVPVFWHPQWSPSCTPAPRQAQSPQEGAGYLGVCAPQVAASTLQRGVPSVLCRASVYLGFPPRGAVWVILRQPLDAFLRVNRTVVRFGLEPCPEVALKIEGIGGQRPSPYWKGTARSANGTGRNSDLQGIGARFSL